MRIGNTPDMAGDGEGSGAEVQQMISAIETAMASSEQTYDEFLRCFTHLTAEDITLPADGSTVQHANLQPVVSEVSGHNELPEAAAVPVVITSQTIGSTDMLEEVLLDEGTKTQDILVRSNVTDSHPRIKVDNFLGVDDGDDSDSCSSLSDTSNDHDACDTYEASFAARTINKTDGIPTLAAQDDTTATIPDSTVTTTASVSGGNVQMTDDHTNCCDCKDSNPPEAGLASMDTVKGKRIPNPGEVEWDLDDLQADTDLKGKTNIRRLDFSVKPPAPGEEASTTQECSCAETSHDEVEPFQLDDNFDYDNVVLSSKYTAEEMSLMARLRQTSTTDTQDHPESDKADMETHRSEGS